MKNIPQHLRVASEPKPPVAAASPSPTTVRVLGESDDNELLVVHLDEEDTLNGVEAVMLKVVICSELDASGLFPGLAPSTMLLLNHPERQVIHDATLVKAGSTVHLCPNKGRDAASLRRLSEDTAPAGTIVYYSEDIFLEVPHGEKKPLQWMCNALGLEHARYRLVTLSNGTQWLEEDPMPRVRDYGVDPVTVHTSSSSNLVIPANTRWAQPTSTARKPPNPTPAQQAANANAKRLRQAGGQATIHLPGGATEPYLVTTAGVPAEMALSDLCLMRGLNPQHWKLMEHNLPLLALNVDAGYAYDLKLRTPDSK
jgi:hypothetical protein